MKDYKQPKDYFVNPMKEIDKQNKRDQITLTVAIIVGVIGFIYALGKTQTWFLGLWVA